MQCIAIRLTATLVLLAGANVTQGTTLTIAPNAGFSIAWNGLEGQYINGPVPVTNNIALAANGATPFATGALVAPHTIPNLNNGVYGNSNSWISSTSPSPPFSGVDFQGSLYRFNTVAWSRSNVTFGDPCVGGVCMDRFEDTYTLQFTLVSDPSAATTVTGNRFTGWESIGTIAYGPGAGPINSGWLRHEYEILEQGSPIVGTGFRIQTTVAGLVAIDELEIIGQLVAPEPSSCLLLGFGMFGLLHQSRRRRSVLA